MHEFADLSTFDLEWRREDSLRRRRGWEDQCKKRGHFAPVHDSLNTGATAVFRVIAVHATFVPVLLICEIFLVLEPTVVVPLKDINIFRDNQAGLGFEVAPTRFERPDDQIVVEWVVISVV